MLKLAWALDLKDWVPSDPLIRSLVFLPSLHPPVVHLLSPPCPGHGDVGLSYENSWQALKMFCSQSDAAWNAYMVFILSQTNA